MTKFRKTAAELGPYRDILIFTEENHLEDNGNGVSVYDAVTGLDSTNNRDYLDRGVHEGYLDMVRVKNKFYWSWNYQREIPEIDAKSQRAERKRTEALNNISGGTQVGLSRSEKRTGQRLLHPYREVKGVRPKVIKMRRMALRSREMRKTQIGATYLIPWILARGERPQAPWAKDFTRFICEVLGEEQQINVKEDQEFLEFLSEPWIFEKAKSGKMVRVLLISAVRRLALSSFRTIKQFIQSPMWRENVGEWVITSGGSDGESFLVAGRGALGMKEPTCLAAGLDTGLTGGHYDVHIWDDSVTDKNTQTTDAMYRTREIYRMSQPLLARGGKSVLMMYGTMYNPADLYHHIIDKSGNWDLFFDPAYDKEDYEVDQDGEITIKSGVKSRFPDSWPTSALKEYLDEMGPHNFAGQFLLDFTKVKPEFLKREDFKWFDEEEMPDKVATYILADLAETEDAKACYTCLWVVDVDGAERKFVRDVRIGRWETEGTWAAIEDIFRAGWRPRKLITENNGMSKIYKAGWYQYALTNGLNLPWELVRRDQGALAKNRRIECLKSPVKNGIILWDNKLKDVKAFEEIAILQFLRYGKMRWKDAPDAMTLHNAKDEKERSVVYCPPNMISRALHGVYHREMSGLVPSSRTPQNDFGYRVGYE